MNISVVTWLGSGNYGTALQSYALCRKLACLGHCVSFLPFFDRRFGTKSFLKWMLSLSGVMSWRERRKFGKTDALKKLYAFQQKNYSIKRVWFSSQHKKLLEHTDVFITGSDQIWNAWHSFNPFYFLDFAEDVKRVAYASSIGTSDFPEEHKDEIRALLSRFSRIGVRERTAVKAIASLLHRDDIVQVLDPTFLLTAEEWEKLADEATIEFDPPHEYILCYLIGNGKDYAEQVMRVREVYGFNDIIIIPSVENKSFSVPDAKVYTAAGPKEFVSLLRHAALVCTDSFHATALSINLSVDFVEFLRFSDTDERSQNSRIYDVLDHYRLRQRLYSPETDSWFGKIDYASVQAVLAEDRTRSLGFLTDSIEH